MTIEKIAAEVVDTLKEDEIIYVLETVKDEDGMVLLHHGLGTYIRNHYKLWDENNPLTKQWFVDSTNGVVTYIIDGVDHHPKHPDMISFEVLKQIYRTLKKRNEIRDLLIP